MERRIVRVALASAVLAVALFAIPLALAAQHLYLADQQGELERTGLRAAVTVGPDFAGNDPAELPSPEAGNQLGLYNAAGKRVGGTGPDTADAATRTALGGGVGQEQSDGAVIVSVPVSSTEQVVGAVRSAAPTSSVWRRTVATWGLMVIAALLAIAVSVLIARVLARRVSRPLEELAQASQALGDGDFGVRTLPTGMPEIDRAGSSLNVTAARLGELVTRERQIASNASHQLRTPLAGLRATLESALADPSVDLPSAARQAIKSADQLECTIDDLIALTRGTASLPADAAVRPLLEAMASRWNGRLAALGRPLRVHIEPKLPAVRVTPRAVDQILDVLLDNALRHGQGTVLLTARRADVAVAIDVADEGHDVDAEVDIFARGVSRDGGAGIGLALARTLAEDQGGRLRLSRRVPNTQFTLLLISAVD